MSGLVKDRLRNQTVSFRVTPHERQQIEARFVVSGLPKGKFFIEALLHSEIKIAVGKYQSDRLSLELKRLREQIENLKVDKNSQEKFYLLSDCKAILEQVYAIVSKESELLNISDFAVEIQK